MTALGLDGRAHQARVEAAGVPFSAIAHSGWRWPPPPPPLPGSLVAMADPVVARYQRALDMWLDEVLVPRGVEALRALADEIGAPDLIVTDPFLSAAALAAELLDGPLARGRVARRAAAGRRSACLTRIRRRSDEGVAGLSGLCASSADRANFGGGRRQA